MKTKLQKAAAQLGAVKSDAKASAARANGQRGGRPHYRYYRIEAPREGAYGFEWAGTVLAIRPDGTGYLLTDRWESDSHGAECYREYVGERRRNWPACAHLAFDATSTARAVCCPGASIADAIDYLGADTVVCRLIEAVKKTIDADSAVG